MTTRNLYTCQQVAQLAQRDRAYDPTAYRLLLSIIATHFMAEVELTDHPVSAASCNYKHELTNSVFTICTSISMYYVVA